MLTLIDYLEREYNKYALACKRRWLQPMSYTTWFHTFGHQLKAKWENQNASK